ncbi:MAG: SDR family oxidoreductase [Rhodocyclaceae bacterium]|jgi:citronellol/citronellal dehydrogenase|nr:SDR family oxidoreductase [Rhodocyclaceae bacterium]
MAYQSVFRPGLYQGRTILVTGAGSGIGRCTAHELAALGAKILMVGRQIPKLEKVAAEIAEDGGQATFAALDIRDEDGVRETVGRFVADHGPIHGLFNNAGGHFPSSLEKLSKKGWESVISTDLTGGFLMAREVFIQSMKEHGGAIVNMAADMWGGWPGLGHSGAARAAMVNFTETAAIEWAQYGVRVNAVAPGLVASSGLDFNDPAVVKGVLERARLSIPAKRFATESEISAVVVFLLSEAASFVSGACYRVDAAASRNTNHPIPDHRCSQPFNGFHRATLPKVFE